MPDWFPPPTAFFPERQLYKFLSARDLETLAGRFIAGKYTIGEEDGGEGRWKVFCDISFTYVAPVLFLYLPLFNDAICT
jgi:hypothetical protein